MLAHEQIQEHKISSSSDRTFGLFFALFFCIIAAKPLLQGKDMRWQYLLLGVLFLILSLYAAHYLHPLNKAWTKLGLLLARIGNPLFMGIIFFIIITPFAIILRILKKDILHIRFDTKQKTYWIERKPPGPDPKTMRYQF